MVVPSGGIAMQLYQEIKRCPSCGARLTLAGVRDPAASRITRHEVDCPVCGTGVAFAIGGVVDAGKASLICYERAARAERRSER